MENRLVIDPYSHKQSLLDQKFQNSITTQVQCQIGITETFASQK